MSSSSPSPSLSASPWSIPALDPASGRTFEEGSGFGTAIPFEPNGIAAEPSQPVVSQPPISQPRSGLPLADAPAVPSDEVRPMVFLPFGLQSTEAAVEAEPEPEAVEEEVPPPDYEAIKAEAWREGFQQGYDEGLGQAAEEQRETAARLGALLQGIASETEQFVRGLEDDVVELALAVAEKVVARVAEIDRSVVVDIVRAALAEIHHATELRIRVNPEDYALVEPRWQEMLPRSVGQQSELLADELVERGGCVVETRIGYVDGQLKTRLSQVASTFQAVLDGDPA